MARPSLDEIFGGTTPSPTTQNPSQGRPSLDEIFGGATQPAQGQESYPAPWLKPTQVQTQPNPNPVSGTGLFGLPKAQSPGSNLPRIGDQGWEQSVMDSPAGKFAQAQAPELQATLEREVTINPLERVGNVLGQGAHGLLNLAGGAGDVLYGGTGLNYLNPFDKRSGQEKSEQAIGGLNKLVSGVGEIVSSPLAASPVLQKGFSLPFEAMKSTIDDNILAAAGIDKNTEHGQNVSNSIMNAITLALVGPKNIAKGATGFIDKTKGVIDKVQNIGNTPEARVAKYKQQIDKTISKLSQGELSDIPTVKRSLGDLDTKNIKTNQDFVDTANAKIKALADAVDTRLQEHGIIYKLSDFDKEVKSGNTTIKTNPVTEALTQLQELYQKTKDPQNLARVTDFMEQAQKHTMSLQDVNNIAREYGSEFGKKAFDKKGDPLTSVNAQAYENTRSGIKDAVRSEMKDNTTQMLDQKMHDLLRTRDLFEKMTEKVNDVQQTMKTPGILDKLGEAGRTGAKIINSASLGLAKGFFQEMLPKGFKDTLNAMDIEKMLNSSLKTIDKLNAKIEEASAAKPQPKPTLKVTAKAVTKTLKSAAKADALTQRNQ